MIWKVAAAGVALVDPDRVEPHNRALRSAARAIDSWAYAEGVRKAQQLSRHIVDGFVERFDLLVTPTMACLPPPVDFWRAGTDEDPLMALETCGCPALTASKPRNSCVLAYADHQLFAA